MSTFTAKHYDAIARVLKGEPESDVKEHVVFRLGQFFEADNRRFKYTRFKSACLHPKEEQ